MEKVKYRYNRWRLALGRLVNLRYINRWIIFCASAGIIVHHACIHKRD